MGILSKLFGKGEPQEAPPEAIQAAIDLVAQFTGSIRDGYGREHFSGDSQASQILSVYSFGGVSALAMEHKMSPPQAHAVALALLMKDFGYSAEESAAKAEALIASAPDPNSHLYAIIHRGLDGFLRWQKDRDDSAARDFGEIMNHVKQQAEG